MKIDNFRSPPFTKLILKLGFCEKYGFMGRTRGRPSHWKSPLESVSLYITNECVNVRFKIVDRGFEKEYDISEQVELLEVLNQLIVREVLET